MQALHKLKAHSWQVGLCVLPGAYNQGSGQKEELPGRTVQKREALEKGIRKPVQPKFGNVGIKKPYLPYKYYTVPVSALEGGTERSRLVLEDLGSTNNFVKNKLAKNLGLPSKPLSLSVRAQTQTHSWFISVVDSNELGPLQPVQVNQSKYEDHENEGAVWAMIAFLA